MRTVRSVIFLACLAGCASDPGLNTPANSSVLNFPPGPGTTEKDGGIFTVDRFRMLGAPVARVRVPAGTHQVGYQCHRWLYMDFAPVLTFTFKPGVDYQMACGKDGSAVVVAE